MNTSAFDIIGRKHLSDIDYFAHSRAQFCCEMFTAAGDIFNFMKSVC